MKYTKAIRNGKLKATEIQVGESVSGTLVDFKENNYGNMNILLDVNGSNVEILVAGNLKFLAEDVTKGKKELGAFTTITRVDDVKTKSGYTSSKFLVEQGEASATTTTETTSTAAKPSVKDQLAAIRAQRTSN
jgi:hypothetical protein